MRTQHGSVRRRFIPICLDLHTTSDTSDGFLARQIGDVNEGVVERCKDVSNAEDELALYSTAVYKLTGLLLQQIAVPLT